MLSSATRAWGSGSASDWTAGTVDSTSPKPPPRRTAIWRTSSSRSPIGPTRCPGSVLSVVLSVVFVVLSVVFVVLSVVFVVLSVLSVVLSVLSVVLSVVFVVSVVSVVLFVVSLGSDSSGTSGASSGRRSRRTRPLVRRTRTQLVRSTRAQPGQTSSRRGRGATMCAGEELAGAPGGVQGRRVPTDGASADGLLGDKVRVTVADRVLVRQRCGAQRVAVTCDRDGVLLLELEPVREPVRELSGEPER
jgi:hypothetical protein